MNKPVSGSQWLQTRFTSYQLINTTSLRERGNGIRVGMWGELDYVVVKKQIRNMWVQGWSWPVSRQLYPEGQFCEVIGEEEVQSQKPMFY